MKAWEIEATTQGPGCAKCGDATAGLYMANGFAMCGACARALEDAEQLVGTAKRIDPRGTRRKVSVIVYAPTANEAVICAAHAGYAAGKARPYVPIAYRPVDNRRAPGA